MRIRATVAVLAVLTGTACGGGSGPTQPGGGGTGPITATVDGVAWAGGTNTSSVTTSAQLPGQYTIVGTQSTATTARIITLALTNIPGVGTYPLGTGSGVSGGTGIYAEPTGGWGTELSGAAGTVTISTLTATRIVGTFAFTASVVNSGATGTRTITNGKFDLPVTTPVSSGTVPNASRNRIAATLGGQSWAAASVAVQPNPVTLFGFASTNSRLGVSLTMQALPGPGTYAFGMQGGVNTVLGVSGECSPGGPMTCAWSSPLAGSSGTVTVTSMANGRATGTFSGTLVRVTGAGAATMTVTTGTFDIGVP